jgi:hypothetical protein
MNITTRRDLEKSRVPKWVTLEVCDPKTGKSIHKIQISRDEADDAVNYLRTHNGSAPEFVHAFIDAMEIALSVRL